MALRSNENESLVIRHMSREDVPALARLHIEIFGERFLGYMGERFLRLYHGEFVGIEGNPGFVALEDGSPIGFVVGTVDVDSFYGPFFRRHPFSLAAQGIWRLLVSRAARRDMMRSAAQFRYALRSIFSGSGAVKAEQEIGTRIPARLLAIGVAASARGGGAALALESAFLAEMANLGIEEVGLGVDFDNPRAIRFYHKHGWHQEGRKDEVIYFRKATACNAESAASDGGGKRRRG